MGTLLRFVVAGALLAVGMTFVSHAAPARAASCVSIYEIYYDSPGPDTGTNKSLNGEWIQLKNGCSAVQKLTGWKIKDVAGHTYKFGTYTLAAGSKVKVHTGKGSNTSTDRYWNQSWYIWNNTGDTAYLKNSAGTTVDTCKYPGGHSYVYC